MILKKIDYNKDWVLTTGIIAIFIFLISYGMYSGGNRPDSFLKSIEGKVEETYDGTYSTRGRQSITLNCTVVKVQGDNRRFIIPIHDYKYLFHSGQNVKLLIYKSSRYWKIKKCWAGDKILIDNSNTKGIIVLIVMIVSGLYTLFIFYIRLFVQKR
jgi:hypothetical protein